MEITQGCDNLCRHCYNFWRYENNQHTPPQDYTKLDQIVGQIVDSEIFHVVVTGGEPLLAYERIPPLVRELSRNNVIVSLNTNLVSATAEQLEELRSAGLRGILTSVFSYNPAKHDKQMGNPNAFSRTIDSIKHALDLDYPVSANMVVTKNNFEDVYLTGKMLFDEVGVKSFHATRVIPPTKYYSSSMPTRSETVVWLEQLLRLNEEGYRVGTLNPIPHCFAEGRYRELTQNRGCSSGQSSAVIGLDGFLRTCQHANIIYGNVTKQTIREIWQKVPIWKVESSPEHCKECPSLSVCGGGCRYAAFVLTGRLDAVDPLFTGKHVSPIKTKSPLMKDGTKFEFEHNIKVRRENQGGVLFRTLDSFAVVNDTTFDLCLYYAKAAFSVKTVSDEFQLPIQNTRSMISSLRQRGIIRETKQ